MFHFGRSCLAACAIGPAVIIGPAAAGAKLESIAISATAAPPYVRPVDAQGRLRPESYVFLEGQFMAGGTADASESHTSFTDLTRMLAKSLVQQNYFPGNDLGSADLLIRVYWGTTLTYDDPQKPFAAEALNAALTEFNTKVAQDGIADPGDLNTALDRGTAARESVEVAINRNAALLGYKRALEKETRRIMASTEEQTMRVELNEERYFVVLMAYDLKYMRAEHKPRLLWVTRLSVRSPGNNFTEALPALAKAGGKVFGRQVDGLFRVKVPLDSGQVKLRDMKIMGATEQAPAQSEKK